jgi:hypothetical protein
VKWDISGRKEKRGAENGEGKMKGEWGFINIKGVELAVAMSNGAG